MTGKVRIALVVAAAENGVIGRDGQLPWRLPSDLKRFRKLTLGKPVVMGRKTYEFDRQAARWSRQHRRHAPAGFPRLGVHLTASVEEALVLGRELAAKRGADEVMVIGGAEIFRPVIAVADRIYLTLVHAAPAGDVRFDTPDPRLWRETAREPMPQGRQRPIFGRFHRVGPASLIPPHMAPVATAPHITQSRRFICAHPRGAL